MATTAQPISECFIRPKHEPEQSKEPYYLEPLEIIFLSFQNIQKGLLFTKPPSFNIDTLLEKLKRALSHVLVYFYPLAGRFVTVTCEKEGTCWIYLDCNKGPGARFIHASCATTTVADVVSSEPDVIPIIRSFFELGEIDFINHDGHTRALISVQVTELIDGVFIGFTMNHSVGDGRSLWHFVSTLSEIFISIDDDDNNNENTIISHMPIFKSIFPNGYGPIIKLPYSDSKEFIAKFGVDVNHHIRERIFHFTSSSVEKLKAQANAECDDETLGQISSFQSLSAFVWRSITRARNLRPDEVTSIMLVANSRARFDPPLSPDHFGSMLVSIQESCMAGELLENGLGWAARLLHRAVVAIDDKVVRDFSRMLIEVVLLGPPPGPDSITSYVGGQSAVVIGGSVRFDCYEPEFGLGKAIAVRSGYPAKTDGKVTANPGLEGGGSVDLELSLSPQAMLALEHDQEFMSFVS